MQQGTRGYSSLKATPFTSSSSCISPPPATSHELIVGHGFPRPSTSSGLASTPTPLSSSRGGNSKPAHGCLLPTAVGRREARPVAGYLLLYTCFLGNMSGVYLPRNSFHVAVADIRADMVSHDSNSEL